MSFDEVEKLRAENAALREQVKGLSRLVRHTFMAFGPTLTVGWAGSIIKQRLDAIIGGEGE
jgi:hypothetical protein